MLALGSVKNLHITMEIQKNAKVTLCKKKKPLIVREVLSVRERERYRQRERERDGSDVTIVALKLAMNSHFLLPKSRNWR